MAVPGSVVDAFGLRGAGEKLEGGLAAAFRFGDTVVKPVGDAAEAAYVADVMARVEVDQAAVRVARPVPAAHGGWVVDGWAASEWVAGRPRRSGHPWSAALDALAALHDGLQPFPRDDVLDDRDHAWAVADRFAWGEASTTLNPGIERLVTMVRAHERPCASTSQLIHGDVFSNLLFEESLPPAAIDFSPYWRPATWSKAIYLVDAIGWGGEDQRLLDLSDRSELSDQLLLRAVVFRLVAADGYRRDDGIGVEPHLARYESMVNIIVSHIERRVSG